MKRYNIECPVCGKLNRQLFLEETDGWMECEYCGEMTQHLREMRKTPIALYPVRDLERITIPAG